MPGWVPTNLFFSSGAAFLSLAPSNAKGYYATGVYGDVGLRSLGQDTLLHVGKSSYDS